MIACDTGSGSLVHRFHGIDVLGICGANSGLGKPQEDQPPGEIAAMPPTRRAHCFDGIALLVPANANADERESQDISRLA